MKRHRNPRSKLSFPALRQKDINLLHGGITLSSSGPDSNDVTNRLVHELRNPLAAIKNANEMLRAPGVEGERLEMLTAVIGKSVQRLDRIIGSILEEKHEAPEISDINVVELIEEALEETSARFMLKNIVIQKNYCPGDELFIRGDRGKLLIAVINIIVNSIEAIEQDPGKVWLSAYREDNLIKIVIKDNGIGMDEETAMRAFDERFTRKKDGVGIGLSHVKEIMNLHHASISINSLPGAGTSCTIAFNN
jgi:signal transduction histidine kinase